tara:strand:+ start:131 stop:1405 length:1275 start_codon:yes stop_codon:yes gene_type:complete
MANIAILATGQPRSAYIASMLWKEYWIDIQSSFIDCNIKTFVSVVNDESVKYTHVEHENNYSNQELIDLIHHDVIEIYTQDEVTEKAYSKFKFIHSGLKIIGHGATWYQLWHLFNAGRMALEYEESNNIKFDLFIKIRLDHFSGQLKGGAHVSVYGPLLKKLTSIPDYQNKRVAFFDYMFVHWSLFWLWKSDNIDSIKNVNYINDVQFAFSRQAFIDICKNANNQEYTDLVTSLLISNRLLTEYADYQIPIDIFRKINVPWLNSNTYEEPNGTWLSDIIAQKHREQVTEWINNMWPIISIDNPITRTFHGRTLEKPIHVPTDKEEFIATICNDPSIKCPQLLLGALTVSAEFLHLCYFKAGVDIVFPLNRNASHHLAKISPKAEQIEFLNSVLIPLDDHRKKVRAFYEYNDKFNYPKRFQLLHD